MKIVIGIFCALALALVSGFVGYQIGNDQGDDHYTTDGKSVACSGIGHTLVLVKVDPLDFVVNRLMLEPASPSKAFGTLTSESEYHRIFWSVAHEVFQMNSTGFVLNKEKSYRLVVTPTECHLKG